MKCFVIVFIAVLMSQTAFAQPDSLWSRTFGGNDWDACSAVQQTTDGGYILAGTTASFGAGYYDMWLIKTDAGGDSLWSRTYGGNGVDYCDAAQQTSDGGYVLAGRTYSFGAGGDMWALKTNVSGDSLWSYTYGGSEDDRCDAMRQTTDGGYILAGMRSDGGVWLVKIDSDGDSLWSRSYLGIVYSVQQTADGGYVFAGERLGNFWLVKTDTNGDSVWSRAYGGSGAEECKVVQQTSDGGYILAGSTESFGAGSEDMWLVKTDANGNSLWSHTFGGSSLDLCYAAHQTSDGGYVLAGSTSSFGNTGDFWLVRTDANGDSLWSRTFGGSGIDACFAMQLTSDGGYILGGVKDYVWVTGGDFWLVKTGPDPVSATDHCEFQPTSYTLSSYPNPFNPSTMIAYDLPKTSRISLRVFDLLGREVAILKDGFVEAGTHRVTFDGSGLTSGIHFARLDAGTFSQTKKLMLLK